MKDLIFTPSNPYSVQRKCINKIGNHESRVVTAPKAKGPPTPPNPPALENKLQEQMQVSCSNLGHAHLAFVISCVDDAVHLI